MIEKAQEGIRRLVTVYHVVTSTFPSISIRKWCEKKIEGERMTYLFLEYLNHTIYDLAYKMKFSMKIFLLNVNQSAVSCGFAHIY